MMIKLLGPVGPQRGAVQVPLWHTSGSGMVSALVHLSWLLILGCIAGSSKTDQLLCDTMQLAIRLGSVSSETYSTGEIIEWL